MYKISFLLFISICMAHTVDPQIALENDNVAAAIKADDIAALEHALETEF